MKGKYQETTVPEAIEYLCNLTAREKACIDYLLSVGDVGAGAQSIGDYISRHVENCRPNAFALGASTCGRLRAAGLVVHLGDENLYRLSAFAQMALSGRRRRAA